VQSGWGEGVIFEAERAYRRLLDGPGKIRENGWVGFI